MRVFYCLAFDIDFLLCDYNYYNIYNYYKTIILHKDAMLGCLGSVATRRGLVKSHCSELGSVCPNMELHVQYRDG